MTESGIHLLTNAVNIPMKAMELVDASVHGYKGEDILYSLTAPIPFSITFSDVAPFVWED